MKELDNHLNIDGVKIVFSNRKTVSFKILEDGSLEARAPVGTSNIRIFALITMNHERIKELYARHHERNRSLQYDEGTIVKFLGEDMKISFIETTEFHWKYKNPVLYINKAYANQVPPILKHFYDTQQHLLINAAKKLEKEHNFNEVQVSCRWMTSRWGSYSSKGRISINTALLMAHPFVIDYVLIHEYCHQRFPSHAQDFWLEVERLFPDYRQARRWLKEYGDRLRIRPQSNAVRRTMNDE